MYGRLRTSDPVHHSQTGEWIISRYTDIRDVLRNPAFRTGNRLEWLGRGIQYLNRDEDLKFIHEAINTFFLFLNPPEHTTIRNYVVKNLAEFQVANLIDRVVTDQLRQLKDNEFDLVTDYAQPLPVLVISEIMGLPTSDCKHLRSLGVRMHRSLDLYHSYKDLVNLNDASRSFIEYFQRHIRRKTDHPDESLISKLIRNRPATISEAHLISICIFLFIASEETTSSAIGTGLFHLIQNPQHYTLLRSRPTIAEIAVQEFLRYDAPVQIVGRIATSDSLLGGIEIPAGASLTLLLASGNRDGAFFKDPDELNLERVPNYHLSFSAGSHRCLGDWLGILQMQKAIVSFVQKFPSVELLSETPDWNKNLAVRGLRTLRVRAC
ncbi:MAG: cytochrome P450 [Bacteroidetes bacterium]|nr:cytochrome P450 [Bacteroidota bacterium]